MSTNYFMMRESERELFKQFNDYLSTAILEHKTILDYLESEEPNFDLLFEKIRTYEGIIDGMYSDLLDQAMWIIQKDQPRASHLRYIIAVINSIRDIERVSDYAESIANFFEKRKVNEQLIITTKDVYSRVVNLLVSSQEKFLHESAIDVFHFYRENIRTIEKYIKEKLRNSIKSFECLNSDSDNKILIDFIGVFRSIERTLEHIENVYESFSYINIKIQ